VQPVTYVHDEILMESPKMYSEDVGLWLKKNMQEGMESFLKTVPVLAEPNIISSWGGK
jgi:DNA polymerase I-like protein with 3'-5' exonuclease and polymerase domains